MTLIKDQRCKNCDAFLAGEAKQGACRAHPPTPLLLGLGKSALGQPQPAVAAYFPQMMEDGWCREWSPITSGEG